MLSIAQQLRADLNKIHPPLSLTTPAFVRKRKKALELAKKGTPNHKKGPAKPGKDPTKKKKQK